MATASAADPFWPLSMTPKPLPRLISQFPIALPCVSFSRKMILLRSVFFFARFGTLDTVSAIRLLDHVSFLVSVSGSTFPVAQTAGHRRIPHFSCRGECFGSVKVPGTRIQRDLL